MDYIITNKTDRRLNLGTVNGNMVVFRAQEQKVIDEKVYRSFERLIEFHADNNCLKVQKKNQPQRSVPEASKTENTLSETRQRGRPKKSVIDSAIGE